MDTFSWYQQLLKPSWSPPAWLFGPVWTILYVVIAVSFGTVLYRAATDRLPWIIALPFLLNLAFNLAFTPLQFGLKNNLLALMDIVLVLATLLWALAAIYPHARWVTYANIPYLLWVCFATGLQSAITYLNRS
jgi:tryptophan-rich sensory protein